MDTNTYLPIRQREALSGTGILLALLLAEGALVVELGARVAVLHAVAQLSGLQAGGLRVALELEVVARLDRGRGRQGEEEQLVQHDGVCREGDCLELKWEMWVISFWDAHHLESSYLFIRSDALRLRRGTEVG